MIVFFSQKSPKDLRLIATISILNGALKAEENMEKQLQKMAQDFYAKAPSTSAEGNLQKIKQIEKFMTRDRRAIAMLSTALDLAKTNSSVDDYRRALQNSVRNLQPYPLPSKDIFSGNATQQTKALKAQVDTHINMMHKILVEKGRQTMKYLKAQQPKAVAKSEVKKEERKSTKAPNERPVSAQGPYAGTFVSYVPISHPPVFFTVNALTDFTQSPDFVAPYIERSRRQDDKTSEESSNAIDNTSDSSSGLQLSEEETDEDRPGGLVGIIASLSGGEEGSDVGALLGALTGVVTNLFGPGGLDIPSLLSSGTSLLAGLLGGDDNFGKVLAGYVVTAIDGFSGGGAADLNGQFFGNFLGALLAGLSLDPDNEEGPPNPTLFLQNFFKGFKEGKRRGEATEEEKEDSNNVSMTDKWRLSSQTNECFQAGSAGIFGFISNIVSSVVGAHLKVSPTYRAVHQPPRLPDRDDAASPNASEIESGCFSANCTQSSMKFK
ncbi:uncharacterized protein LOC132261756 [Phlebotomus argentipes]|uniref:uncharacterized protein LOC132261756 n=1 Tax=Phlebotomus argentipes TaxID=94469 RepID=UPI002892B074|nr:uncharacterized protein LOC132261756 [Phlebotomus argentipes]